MRCVRALVGAMVIVAVATNVASASSHSDAYCHIYPVTVHVQPLPPVTTPEIVVPCP